MDIPVSKLLNAPCQPTRLRALQIVWDGDEHCVCELMQPLGVTQSRMSRHMTRLKAADLLVDRRDAQWVRYRRREDVPEAWADIVDAVLAALAPPTVERCSRKVA